LWGISASAKADGAYVSMPATGALSGITRGPNRSNSRGRSGDYALNVVAQQPASMTQVQDPSPLNLSTMTTQTPRRSISRGRSGQTPMDASQVKASTSQPKRMASAPEPRGGSNSRGRLTVLEEQVKCVMNKLDAVCCMKEGSPVELIAKR
jgi:hypothetical protein